MSIRSNVDARRLDQRIKFQSKLEVQNSTSGYVTQTWVDVAEVYAAVDALKNIDERLEAAKINQIDLYTVWIRSDVINRFSINSNMRILWKNNPFDIKSILHNQLRGRLTAIMITGGLSQGQ